MDIPIRPRRNRKSAAVRGLVQETVVRPSDFILPLFIHDESTGSGDQPIDAMPGCSRWCLDNLSKPVDDALEVGVRSVVLFPAVAEALKTKRGEECYNPDGLVPTAVSKLKARYPELAVITDVALDPYNSDGHDGVVSEDGVILNDETVEILCKQALCQAAAGVDIVAPSDMMDGRIGAIRDALDAQGYQDTSLMAYTAKYASAFYGPFRGALDSAPKSGDKKTYQMDPANTLEALRELELDVSEGADIVMVKPAGPYLDVIRTVRDQSPVPVSAYQVSGEYLMIKAAAQSGWLDERKVVLESLLGIRRAGADMVLTYFATDAARWLSEG